MLCLMHCQHNIYHIAVDSAEMRRSMKKLLKFIVAIAAAAGIVLGVLYMLRDRLGFDMDGDDAGDADFDEVFADEVDDREYVTLDIDPEAQQEEEGEAEEE